MLNLDNSTDQGDIKNLYFGRPQFMVMAPILNIHIYTSFQKEGKRKKITTSHRGFSFSFFLFLDL